MNGKERMLAYLQGDHKDWMGYGFTGCPRPYPFVIDPFTAAETAHDGDYYTDWWGGCRGDNRRTIRVRFR